MAHRLVVGLGNPGPEYAATRHNVGFLVADVLRERWGSGPWQRLDGSLVSLGRRGNEEVALAKPQDYMNRSGPPVAALAERWDLEPSGVLVVHDDLDLPFGALRIRTGGGHGGHNGLRSLVEALGTGEFLRLKIGIGRPVAREDVVDHVLSPFGPEESAELPRVLALAADAVEAILSDGPLKAMNRFHTQAAPPAAGE